MSTPSRPNPIGTRLSFAIRRGASCVRQDISCDLGCSFDDGKTRQIISPPEEVDALLMQLEDGLFGTVLPKKQSTGSFFPRSRNMIDRSDSESSQSQSSTKSTASSVQEYIWSTDGDALVPDAPLGD